MATNFRVERREPQVMVYQYAPVHRTAKPKVQWVVIDAERLGLVVSRFDTRKAALADAAEREARWQGEPDWDALQRGADRLNAVKQSGVVIG